jgi:hypothetical protein
VVLRKFSISRAPCNNSRSRYLSHSTALNFVPVPLHDDRVSSTVHSPPSQLNRLFGDYGLCIQLPLPKTNSAVRSQAFGCNNSSSLLVFPFKNKSLLKIEYLANSITLSSGLLNSLELFEIQKAASSSSAVDSQQLPPRDITHSETPYHSLESDLYNWTNA